MLVTVLIRVMVQLAVFPLPRLASERRIHSLNSEKKLIVSILRSRSRSRWRWSAQTKSCVEGSHLKSHPVILRLIGCLYDWFTVSFYFFSLKSCSNIFRSVNRPIVTQDPHLKWTNHVTPRSFCKDTLATSGKCCRLWNHIWVLVCLFTLNEVFSIIMI